jgi:hypothetical protein
VRFLDMRPGAGPDDHDVRTDAVISAANATGEAFFSGTTWCGKRAMRVSVVNRRTSQSDVERAINAVALVLTKETMMAGGAFDLVEPPSAPPSRRRPANRRDGR